MPAPYPSRSPVSMPGARRCRLARRLAAGLTPAEVAEVEAATEEEIQAFIADRDFSELVENYRAARELPFEEQERLLIETAMADLQHLVDMGDRRALLFIVYEANRGRSPACRLASWCGAPSSRRRSPRPYAPNPPRRPISTATRWRATASIRWARPTPPRPASPTSSAPRQAVRRSARPRARRRRPLPRRRRDTRRPERARSRRRARPDLVRLGRAHRTPRLPHRLGAPPSGRPRPSRRAAALPDRPARPRSSRRRRVVHPPRRAAPGRAGQGSSRGGSTEEKRGEEAARAVEDEPSFLLSFVTLGLDPKAHSPTRRDFASLSMDPRVSSRMTADGRAFASASVAPRVKPKDDGGAARPRPGSGPCLPLPASQLKKEKRLKDQSLAGGGLPAIGGRRVWRR